MMYRSRLALQQELIVSRSAGGPVEADDAPNSLSGEDIRRLARERMEDVNSKTRRLKEEDRQVQGPTDPFKLCRSKDSRPYS